MTGATWTVARQTTSNYFGMASDGTAVTSATWSVLRIYQDSKGNPVLMAHRYQRGMVDGDLGPEPAVDVT